MPATEAVYGEPLAALATVAPAAVQLSPLTLGSEAIETLGSASLSRLVVQAPPGALERRYVLAHALRALAPDGELIALAPKTKGGARLAGELTAFGCALSETARRHHRICRTVRPAAPTGLNEAIAAGAPRLDPSIGLWTQPGVFSWDRIDPGTALLAGQVAGLAGLGADLGCGIGVLGLRVLVNPMVRELYCVDIDRRAVEAARRNIADDRAWIVQGDVRQAGRGVDNPPPGGLDFVIMNPPFHEAGREDRGLGLAFISAAAGLLRKGGVCRLVANVALPYEARLNADFRQVKTLARTGGYKVYEAIR